MLAQTLVANLPAQWAHLADAYADVQYSMDITWPGDGTSDPDYFHGWEDLDDADNGVGDFGPELSLGRVLGAHTTDTFRIIKSATGSTTLHIDWDPDTAQTRALWTRSNARITERLAEIPGGGVLAAMVWVQGVSDSLNQTQAEAYQVNLINFIARLRLLYGEDMPFIYSRLHSSCSGTWTSDVQDGQDYVAANIANVRMITVDDLAFVGNHFDADDIPELGDRLGRGVVQLLGDSMSQASDALETIFINAALRNTNITATLSHTISLHSQPVGDDDSGAEVTGTGYSQQAVTFATPANRETLNDLAVEFTAAAADWDEAVGIAIRDSGGALQYYSTIDPKTVANGETWTIKVGKLRVKNNYPSTHIANGLLAAALSGTNFTAPTVHAAALHTESVGLDGSGAELPDSDGYARDDLDFDAPSNGVTQNTGAGEFSASGDDFAAAVSLAIWDSVTIGAGNLLFYADIDAVTITDGKTFTISVGGIEVAIQ